LHQIREKYDNGAYGSLVQGFATAAPEVSKTNTIKNTP
jgi:hypothetical protein